MAADLCFVTTCMGRLAALRQTLGAMLDQPGSLCVVVDYSCPEGSGDWVEANHPSARVVRVPGQSAVQRLRGPEHRCAARRRPLDLPSSIPTSCSIRVSAAAVVPALEPGGFYRAWSDDRGLGGTFVCSRADFERVGGYDEIYPCWGEEDNDLLRRAPVRRCRARRTSRRAAAAPPARRRRQRTRFYPITDRRSATRSTGSIASSSGTRPGCSRELLTLEMRRALYDKVAEVVTASIRTGRPGDLAVRLPVGIVPGGWSLSRQHHLPPHQRP